MGAGGEGVHPRENREEVSDGNTRLAMDPALVTHAAEKTHRLSAWGVLGSTTGGLLFLLTHPVFSGVLVVF